jgi:hypothetical protein
MQALQSENARLKTRLRTQQDLIDALREQAAESGFGDESDSAAEQDEDPVALMERATIELQRYQPHLLSLVRTATAVGMASAKLEPATSDGNSGRDAAVERVMGELRTVLVSAQRVVSRTQEAIAGLVVPMPSSSGAGSLRPLGEVVGPHPPNSWLDEWVPMNVEAFTLSGRLLYANDHYVRFNDTPERIKGNFAGTIDSMVERGNWQRADAELYCLLGSASNAISRSIRERSPRFAASAYALCDVMWAQHATTSASYPPFFWHLRGPQSLVEDDPAWASLEVPDPTGFRGLTCSALVLVERVPHSFTDQGFRTRVKNGNEVIGRIELMDSDVVCFVSAPDDEYGAHSAVATTSARNGAFPPNTWFRLLEVVEAGAWEAPSDGQSPPVFPRQRLLKVSATYERPRADATGNIAQLHATLAPKMCCGAAAVGFGRHDAFMTGLDGLTACPLLTVAAECERDITWTHAGETFCLAEEWAYVTQAACSQEVRTGASAMVRDAGNGGMVPSDFLREANALITERRNAGCGSLAPERAMLSLEEVLAVRLYSGAAHRPINEFLRYVALSTGPQRRELVWHPRLTFAATVSALCSAIRKLADVSSATELEQPVYIAMRGSPPRDFWGLPEGRVKQSTVTTAFVSSSRDRQSLIPHLQAAGSNVVWELRMSAATCDGFHCGANIKILSQFAGQAECLFPPGTMLVVDMNNAPDELNEDGNKVLPITAKPTFL